MFDNSAFDAAQQPLPSDADLERRVRSFLASKRPFCSGGLTVRAVGGTVTLAGELPTVREKQLAGQTVGRVAGVLRIIDCLDVAKPTSPLDRMVVQLRPRRAMAV